MHIMGSAITMTTAAVPFYCIQQCPSLDTAVVDHTTSRTAVDDKSILLTRLLIELKQLISRVMRQIYSKDMNLVTASSIWQSAQLK